MGKGQEETGTSIRVCTVTETTSHSETSSIEKAKIRDKREDCKRESPRIRKTDTKTQGQSV